MAIQLSNGKARSVHSRRGGAIPILASLGLVLIALASFQARHAVKAQVPLAPTSAPGALVGDDSYLRSDRLGITFISFIHDTSAERYRNALILGAGWNRWPLYWDRIEIQPHQYDWSAYDSLLAEDIRQGLKTNVILLGRPEFWQDGDSIANLFAPIFADGSDSAGGDVPMHPDNHWAHFVHYAVTRYKPGGVLAQHNAFNDSDGVRVWEVWNEPDVPQFWRGGAEAYARLLKVAAIVIKTVDPKARVVFGGLLFADGESLLTEVLHHIRNDPLRDRYDWFFDIMAVHSYDDPWRSGWLTKVAQDKLATLDLSRPIWVNETGVSVWNDYPGPVWANNPEQRQRLATVEQQAHFLIMSAAFAWSKGVQVVMYHQLYDDCGNYPAGTDFPPHGGELCESGACFGDAFGIYRNAPGSHCFSQHPLANTPRPVAQAFQLLAEVFGSQPFEAHSLTGLNGEVTVITFKRSSGSRIIVLWNNTDQQLTYPFTTSGAALTAYAANGEILPLPSQTGTIALDLKPAGDYSYPDLEGSRSSAIGGEPVILVESARA